MTEAFPSSLHVDLKYINMLSSHVRNFSQKSPLVWNFSCPLCGDSQSNTKKARGYIISVRGSMVFKCHNCSRSLSFSNFLKEFLPGVYNGYSLERYKDGGQRKRRNTREGKKQAFKYEKPKSTAKLNGVSSIRELEDTHPAKVFLLKRKIPEKAFSRLYFTEDWKEFVDSYTDTHPNMRSEPRIIIPCFDQNDQLIGFQGRTLEKTGVRYITIKVEQTSKHMLYGLDRWRSDQETYVVEGPLDSFFLPNCIAALGSDLKTAVKTAELSKEKTILVFDNEPRNRTIVDIIERTIEEGYRICIWPTGFRGKDLNEMVLGGKSPSELVSIIQKNVYLGLRCKLAFSKWKRT